MSRRRSTLTVALALVFAVLATSPGRAQGVVDLEASGNQATAVISVAGLGLDLTVDFEDASGLSPSSLGLSARLATVTELLGRLPSGVGLATAFPLLVSIEPPTAGGLSFDGVATVGVHTHNLNFLPGSSLRLFKAPVGGAFVDITEWMGPGSYRARGRTGGFSQFLILVDIRSTTTVVNGKLTRLADLLAAHEGAMPAVVADELADELDAVSTAWTAGNATQAIADLDAFIATVVAHSGTDIPETWRAARDLVNVAGELRAAAATLRFSLGLAGS